MKLVEPRYKYPYGTAVTPILGHVGYYDVYALIKEPMYSNNWLVLVGRPGAVVRELELQRDGDKWVVNHNKNNYATRHPVPEDQQALDMLNQQTRFGDALERLDE